MSQSDETARALLEEISEGFLSLHFRRMFGAYGVYANENTFFGIVTEGKIFVRADTTLADEMLGFGSEKLFFLKNFFSLSPLILEDLKRVQNFLQRSVQISSDLKRSPGKKMTRKQQVEFLEKVKETKRNRKK